MLKLYCNRSTSTSFKILKIGPVDKFTFGTHWRSGETNRNSRRTRQLQFLQHQKCVMAVGIITTQRADSAESVVFVKSDCGDVRNVDLKIVCFDSKLDKHLLGSLQKPTP